MRRTFFLALLIFVVVITYTAYSTIKKGFLEQSRIQQESISPFFSLLVEDILHPLHVAETLHKSEELATLFQNQPVEEEKLLAKLKHYKDAFDIELFYVSDAQQKQYFSDGRQADLSPSQTVQYSEAMAYAQDFTASVINREGIQLYFQFRLQDQQERPIAVRVGA